MDGNDAVDCRRRRQASGGTSPSAARLTRIGRQIGLQPRIRQARAQAVVLMFWPRWGGRLFGWLVGGGNAATVAAALLASISSAFFSIARSTSPTWRLVPVPVSAMLVAKLLMPEISMIASMRT